MAILLAVATQAQAGRSRPLETGQRMSYGAAGDVEAGVERRYRDLARVVVDRRTGLTWRKFLLFPLPMPNRDESYSWSLGTGVVDSDDGTSGGELFDGSAADLLRTMNTEPCFEGHCDWRLPTVTELFTLVNFGPERAPAFGSLPPTEGPAITWPFHAICNCEARGMTAMSMMRWMQGCMSGGCSCTAKRFFWSSTTSPVDPKKAMAVSFQDGEVRAFDKTLWMPLRVVRGPNRPE